MPRIIRYLTVLYGETKIIDNRFLKFLKFYLSQASLAAVSMLLVLILVDSMADAALAAGLGASVAIIFIHPSSPTAQYRSLIGGHFIGIALGALFSGLIFSSPISVYFTSIPWLSDICLGLSAGLMILIMAVTNTEHPPAVGILLGVALQPWQWTTFVALLMAVLILSAIRWIFRNSLRDLI